LRGDALSALTRDVVRRVSWPIHRLAALLAAAHVPPNVITWSALVANLWAALFFAAGRFASASVLMILAGLCDLLDGPVARLEGRVSLFGEFLDSILDRYADLIVFLGLLVYYVHVNRFRYVILAGAAMAGAVMVSYAKARAASLVPESSIGFWERPERLVLMILGALTNRMEIVLWILAIGPNVTVIHRILVTWKQAEGVPLPGTDGGHAHDPARASAGAVPVPGHSRASHFFARSAGRGRH